jgi:hypothetical protein
MTGSGMPMRFSAKAGGLIDVYQAATQMTDESDQSYPFTANQLLNGALGPNGYYGAFTVNMHTDYATTSDSDGVLESALSHGVPLVTGKQMLTWLDGRNASSYTGISWSGDTLSFTVNVGSGANGLTGMVPTLGPDGRTLTALTRGGTAVPFTRTTIKGVEYATFTAAPGAYAAAYGSSAAAPSVTSASAADGVTVTGTSAAKTEIEYGTQPDRLTARVSDGTQARTRTLKLAGLTAGTRYWYRVRVTAPGGRTTLSPVRTLVTPAADNRAPAISAPSVVPRPDGTASFAWRSSESAASTLLIGPSAGALAPWPADISGTQHEVVVPRLTPLATYYYRLRSVDAAGNVTLWPSLSQPPASFVASALGVADFTRPQFRTGSGVNTAVASSGIRLATGARTGSQVSRVLDARQMVTWDRLTYQSEVPAGASLKVFIRTGSTSAPDASWSSWTELSQGDRVAGSSRYAQYRVELTRARSGESPAVSGVGITSDAQPIVDPTEVN